MRTLTYNRDCKIKVLIFTISRSPLPKIFDDIYSDPGDMFDFTYNKDIMLLDNYLELGNAINNLKQEVSDIEMFINETISWKTCFDLLISHIHKEINKRRQYSLNIGKKIEEALRLYDADKLGIIDYALESAGGVITSTPSTVPYRSGSNYQMFGVVPVKSDSNPRLLIQPQNLPGQCFAFRGSRGRIRIRLTQAIIVTGFTMEHVHSRLVDDLSSAPRIFRVYGLEESNSEFGYEFGEFHYKIDEKSLQSFHVDKPDNKYEYEYVELDILSNYGQPYYTCVYRFRVHGHVSTRL